MRTVNRVVTPREALVATHEGATTQEEVVKHTAETMVEVGVEVDEDLLFIEEPQIELVPPPDDLAREGEEEKEVAVFQEGSLIEKVSVTQERGVIPTPEGIIQLGQEKECGGIQY